MPEHPGAARGTELDDAPSVGSPSPLTRWLPRRLQAMLPVGYLSWVLAQQVWADWPALREPRLQLDTLLAVSACGYLLLLLASYWRKPPFIAERSDLIALVATVLAIDAFGLLARQPVSQPAAEVPAFTLILAGTLLAALSLRSLGHAFSLLPQARRIVTSGPYAFLRHPMYAGGLLITLGELWLRWSPLAGGIALVLVAAQFIRLRAEEQLLCEHFPEYASYQARTSAVIPGVY